MTLKKYSLDGGVHIYYKVITGRPNGRVINLGMAFRTYDGPVGYFPFYGANDFDFSGETSFKEEVMARLTINLSSAGSPHTYLLKGAVADVEFLGAGDGGRVDIQQQVKMDLLSHAKASASGVLVDGIMLALGGPIIKSIVGQLIKSKVKQFILSKAISDAAKKHLKESGNFDAGKLLNQVP